MALGIVDQGETYSSDQFEVRDASGVLGNATTVTCTVTLPDGSTATPTVANLGTGLYAFDYPTVQAGRHTFVVTATGSTLGSAVREWSDSFDVDSPGSMLVSFREAMAHLSAQGVITSQDDREQLRWYCSVATDAIERALGRTYTRRTVTEKHNGGKTGIRLRHKPVISLTTVVESGGTLTASDYTLDENSGIIYRGSTTAELTWIWGRQNVVVTYVPGALDPPRIARKVALDAVAAMWQTAQQSPHPALDAAEATAGVIAGMTQIEQEAFWSLRSPGIA